MTHLEQGVPFLQSDSGAFPRPEARGKSMFGLRKSKKAGRLDPDLDLNNWLRRLNLNQRSRPGGMMSPNYAAAMFLGVWRSYGARSSKAIAPSAATPATAATL